MEDSAIIDLYWQRDEAAISETDRKYGPFCRSISMNLLGDREDAEECVSDTWLAAWNAMPPERPRVLRAWLGKVVRNLSLHRWNERRRQKRGGGMTLLLGELEECVPSPADVEQELENEELGRVIDRWLHTLSAGDRALFVRRYWNGCSLWELAEDWGVPSEKLAQKMLRLRRSLRTALEKEGISL